MCCCNKDERTKTHVKNVMMMVLRGLSYVALTDSEGTIGSKEVGTVGEESNATASVWWSLTQECCEDRDRWRSIS